MIMPPERSRSAPSTERVMPRRRYSVVRLHGAAPRAGSSIGRAPSFNWEACRFEPCPAHRFPFTLITIDDVVNENGPVAQRLSSLEMDQGERRFVKRRMRVRVPPGSPTGEAVRRLSRCEAGASVATSGRSSVRQSTEEMDLGGRGFEPHRPRHDQHAFHGRNALRLHRRLAVLSA